MEQYEKSGPPREINTAGTAQEREIMDLKEKVRNMTLVIEGIEKELRRLRSRIDEHSEHINKIKLNSR
jgi:predicted  nucleic acid-binding Zn-ribbon protein